MKFLIEKISNIFKCIFKKRLQTTFNPDPIVIKYENTTDKELDAVLFGYDEFYCHKNNGNEDGIVITSLQGGEYSRVLNESRKRTLEIQEWRFMSNNPNQLMITFSKNKSKSIDYNKENREIMNINVLKDLFHYSPNTIVVKKHHSIGSNDYFTFPLKPKTILVIAMYPKEILIKNKWFKKLFTKNQS
jgi:hypothetical protein